jgi:cytoskeleton protein RodZ
MAAHHHSDEAPAAPSPGAQLRAARSARGWSPAEVAGRLRIRAALVEALEHDDYAVFGAAAYARGQLRNYARLLQLDESALLQGFQAPIPARRGNVLPRAPELHPRRPRLVWLGALAIATVLVVLGTMWAYDASRPPVPVAQPTHAALAAAPAPSEALLDNAVVAAPPDEEAPILPPMDDGAVLPPVAETSAPVRPAAPAVEPPLLAAPAPGASPAPAAVAAATGGMDGELRLRSRAVSWVEVTDHTGQRLIYELVSPGPERSVRGAPPLRVLLGNAPAVDVLYNGAPVLLPADQHVVRLTLGEAAPANPGTVGGPPSAAAPSSTSP